MASVKAETNFFKLDLDCIFREIDDDQQAIADLQAAACGKLHERCQEFVIMNKKYRDQEVALEKNIERLQREFQAACGDNQRNQHKAALLSSELASIQLALKEEENKKARKEQCLAEALSEVAEKQRILDDITTENKDREATAGLGVHLFEQHLGLSICKLSSTNTTVFSFTKVQRADPSRVFKVSVTLKNKLYEVTTDPQIPDLPRLQQRLNETNNLLGFLGKVRKIFKKME
ncbi:uncharacterized protein LOC108679893 [Hyalella azteca]|uniref:Kinetochore protein SPC25 n=1 Tax=Hyalella azteca TaxID=294128 RepID=A0A8B7PDF2_HYAAZ|nr:uncharacterized protein LOC108679893 [Hyalella azteca]